MGICFLLLLFLFFCVHAEVWCCGFTTKKFSVLWLTLKQSVKAHAQVLLRDTKDSLHFHLRLRARARTFDWGSVPSPDLRQQSILKMKCSNKTVKHLPSVTKRWVCIYTKKKKTLKKIVVWKKKVVICWPTLLFLHSAGDDFAIIQQEILMMKDCKHPNIVGYFDSYLRSVHTVIILSLVHLTSIGERTEDDSLDKIDSEFHSFTCKIIYQQIWPSTEL